MRVATWNLLHGLDVRTGRIDLEAVSAGIKALDADVVALQEVDREQSRTGGVDEVDWLVQRLGYHGVFAPALLGNPQRRWVPGPGAGPDPGGPAYGVGLLSRVPLQDVERRVLPGGGAGERRPEDVGRVVPSMDHEPRVLLQGRVPSGAGPDLVVATAHLSFLPWIGARQVRVAAAMARGLAGAGPAVLMGDLNLPLRMLRVAMLGTGWQIHGVGSTYPSWRPTMQLDHVLGHGVRLTDVEAGARGPSDHLPVGATVEI